MTALGLNLLWSAFQATLLGMVAVLLGTRPWRLGGAITPLVALLSIAILTVCNFVPLPGWWPTTQDAQAIPTQTVAVAAAEIKPISDVGGQEPPLSTQPIKPPDAAKNSVTELAAIFVDELKSVRSQADKRWLQSPIPFVVVSVFAIGVVIGLLRLVLGVLGAMQIGRRSQVIQDQSLTEHLDILQAELGLRTKVQLRQADELSTAATVGYFRPVVLLPAQWRTWQPDELRAVLCHELAHIHHRDFAAQLLAQIGLVLHFYNPIVHWLSERMKLEQELAADAVASRLAGGQRQYLRVLATLALDHQNHHVGWPARAFLPTRHSFLRRLEMLRVTKAPPARSRSAGRMCAMGIIAIVTLGLVTLRPQASSNAKAEGALVPLLSPETTETTVVQAPAGQRASYELRYLNEDVEVAVGIRPAELTKNTQVKNLYEILGVPLVDMLKQTLSVNADDIEQAVAGLSFQKTEMTAMSLYVKLTKPVKLNANQFQGKPTKIKGMDAIEIPQGMVIWQPDNSSLVINTQPSVERFIDNRFYTQPFAATAAWSTLKQDDLFALVNGKWARGQRDLVRSGAAAVFPRDQGLSVLAPIFDEAAFLGLGASLNSELRIALVAECLDEKGTKSVQQTADAGLVLLKNFLGELVLSADQNAKNNSPDPNPSIVNPSELVRPSELVNQLTKTALKTIEAHDSRIEGKLVVVTLRAPASGLPTTVLGAAATSVRRAAQRSTSMNNLKQLGLAFHNYESTYRTFPTSAATHVSEKQKPHPYAYSWRVAILPYIEHAALYEQYKFDEPWDSPSNLKVLEQMPSVYRHPDAAPGATTTSYVAFTGAGTLLPGDKSMKPEEVTDGLSSTIMLVEAKSSIPWTKPDDLAYANDKPLPQVGGYSEEGYNVLLGDGSVRFFSKTISEGLVRKMITARGGEKLQ